MFFVSFRLGQPRVTVRETVEYKKNRGIFSVLLNTLFLFAFLGNMLTSQLISWNRLNTYVHKIRARPQGILGLYCSVYERQKACLEAHEG